MIASWQDAVRHKLFINDMFLMAFVWSSHLANMYPELTLITTTLPSSNPTTNSSTTCDENRNEVHKLNFGNNQNFWTKKSIMNIFPSISTLASIFPLVSNTVFVNRILFCIFLFFVGEYFGVVLCIFINNLKMSWIITQ